MLAKWDVIVSERLQTINPTEWLCLRSVRNVNAQNDLEKSTTRHHTVSSQSFRFDEEE
jgi:hypothetical protein